MPGIRAARHFEKHYLRMESLRTGEEPAQDNLDHEDLLERIEKLAAVDQSMRVNEQKGKISGEIDPDELGEPLFGRERVNLGVLPAERTSLSGNVGARMGQAAREGSLRVRARACGCTCLRAVDALEKMFAESSRSTLRHAWGDARAVPS